ncbi:MAG: Outer membrane vitamin B12 receptor BtuB [uncultured Pyrinomonadaceae bacterium]|uniref:Outer membrane vitamin B12 receptor BtuB n=1 Tax=uncultured Pyrinomonadaceae bacterium TaxID=2283094 RepID=A0A6J4NYV8_9BACT|nr:MAG: Outer membrane vitamin B12 receptor BtuB [uncultured Pyrinomonadaceae bacterium]
MRIIKVLSLICFLTIGILAQTSAIVSGTLYEQKTAGKVLSNLEVKLISATEPTRWFLTITDSNGNYLFVNVPDGIYSLVYPNSLGEEEKKIIVVKNGETVSEEGQPIVRPSLLGEVSVIASGSQQVDAEVSKTVNIIGAQELRDRADFSLVESLRSIPGFRIQQLGGFGRTANIKTRGLRNQDTAVLIDGIRFRDATAITGDATPFLSDFTLTSVNRIEVLRGSGSSLYGTNAIGGTIDFQTPRPETGFHGNLSGAFGSYGLGRFRGNVSNGTEDGKFGFNFGASRTVYTKGIDGEDDANNTNVQSRIEYNPFERTNISARFFVSDAFVRLNSNPNFIGAALPVSMRTIIDAVPLSREELRRYENGTPLAQLNRGGANFVPDANDPDNSQRSRFFNGQAVLTHVFSDRLVFQGYYSGLRSQRKNDNGTRGIGFQSASVGFFDGTIQNVNGHFNWTPNRFNEITAGYEFEHEKYGNDGFTPSGTGNFTARAFQSSNTIYAQDLIKLLDNKLQIAGGFRVQFFDLKTPKFSLNNAPYTNLTLENPPNAYTFDGAASYFFEKSKTKIRAHVGNGYRVPSLYERFGTFFSSFGTPRFVALGAPDLQPEKTIAFDGGVEQNLFGNRARLSATYFYTRLIDTIGFGTLPQPDPFGRSNQASGGGYLNTKGGIARGGEFSGDVRVTDSTDVFASYTFTNSDQRTSQVPTVGIIETLGIPKHQFTLVATQRFKRAWATFDFLAASSYLAPIGFPTRVFRFDGNRRADLTGGYNFPLRSERFNLRVFGTIENLLGDDYYENGFRTFDRNGRIGLSFGF